MTNKNNKEFEKVYASEQQKARDLEDSWQHSEAKKTGEKMEETLKHNLKLIGEYNEGEEGIDAFPHLKDARDADVSKIKRDTRARLNALKLTDPEVAKEL